MLMQHDIHTAVSLESTHVNAFATYRTYYTSLIFYYKRSVIVSYVDIDLSICKTNMSTKLAS